MLAGMGSVEKRGGTGEFGLCLGEEQADFEYGVGRRE